MPRQPQASRGATEKIPGGGGRCSERGRLISEGTNISNQLLWLPGLPAQPGNTSQHGEAVRASASSPSISDVRKFPETVIGSTARHSPGPRAAVGWGVAVATGRAQAQWASVEAWWLLGNGKHCRLRDNFLLDLLFLCLRRPSEAAAGLVWLGESWGIELWGWIPRRETYHAFGAHKARLKGAERQRRPMERHFSDTYYLPSNLEGWKPRNRAIKRLVQGHTRSGQVWTSASQYGNH